jgi:hypothetical protein
VSFYAVAPHSKLRSWDQLFELPSDRKRRKLAKVSPLTEAEQRLLDDMRNGTGGFKNEKIE